MKDLKQIARIYKGHGLRGEVKLNYVLQGITLIPGEKIILLPLETRSSLDKAGTLVEISNIRGAGDNILKLEGYDDLTAIESLLPFSVNLEREQILKISPNFIFVEDFLGLKVLDKESGKLLGEIEDIRQGPLGLNLIFGEIELPYREPFFSEIDFEAKQILCTMPEYL